eukprot:jgi/Mesen1/10884/ME000935S10225
MAPDPDGPRRHSNGLTKPLLSEEADDLEEGNEGARSGWKARSGRLQEEEVAADKPSENEALIGAHLAPFESLDYEIVESDVYKEDWRSRTRSERHQYIVLKWVAVLLVGISMGLVAFGINWAVENLAGLKFSAVQIFMRRELVLGGHTVRLRGPGRRRVKAYLNGIDTPDILAPSTLFVKGFFPFLLVAAGSWRLAGGWGPLVHTGACIASILGQGGSHKYRLNCKWLRFFKNDRDRRDLVTCGAAAGVAGAFRAPVGGVLFALEEATSWYVARHYSSSAAVVVVVTHLFSALVSARSQPCELVQVTLMPPLPPSTDVNSGWRGPLLWRAFFTTAVVAVTLRTVMAFCRGGRCGLYSDSGFIIFDKSEVKSNYGLLELVPVIVLGVTGGTLGSLFNQLNLVICRYRRDHLSKKGPWVKVLEACAVALVTSVVQFSVPFLATCVPCPDPRLHTSAVCPTHGRAGNYKAFNCPESTYNDLATLLTPALALAQAQAKAQGQAHAPALLQAPEDAALGRLITVKYKSLLLFLGTFYTLALVTYGIAVPSGLFVPAIVCGAAYGRVVGMAMTTVFGVDRVDEGTYALLGSASFLGGSMRMTVSLCVVLVELTGNLSTLPLIMLVLLVAKTVGDTLNGAIYGLHVDLKNIPFLDAHPEQFMKHLAARDAVQHAPVVLRGIERVAALERTLATTRHSAFPVIDYPDYPPGLDGTPAPVLYGLILRAHLLVLLRSKRQFQADPRRPPSPGGYASLDFGKPGSGKGLRLQDVELSDADRAMYLDLHPFANTSPYTVLEGMSLAKVYVMFRQLGLRHLCVLPSSNKGQPIVGLITRKDLLPDQLLARYPALRPYSLRLSRSVSSLPSMN